MARMIHCVKLNKEAEGLDLPPYPGELGKRLSNVAADPNAVAKDPGSVLQGEVGGILGGKKNDAAPPAPAGRASTPPKR